MPCRLMDAVLAATATRRRAIIIVHGSAVLAQLQLLRDDLIYKSDPARSMLYACDLNAAAA